MGYHLKRLVIGAAVLVAVIVGVSMFTGSGTTAKPEDTSGFNCPYIKIAADNGDQDAMDTYIAYCREGQ